MFLSELHWLVILCPPIGTTQLCSSTSYAGLLSLNIQFDSTEYFCLSKITAGLWALHCMAMWHLLTAPAWNNKDPAEVQEGMRLLTTHRASTTKAVWHALNGGAPKKEATVLINSPSVGRGCWGSQSSDSGPGREAFSRKGESAIVGRENWYHDQGSIWHSAMLGHIALPLLLILLYIGTAFGIFKGTSSFNSSFLRIIHI